MIEKFNAFSLHKVLTNKSRKKNFSEKFGKLKIPDRRLHHQIDIVSIYKEAPRDRLYDALATPKWKVLIPEI